eukprot:TRINITY_DN1459_c0_g1_i1.p1 TRINITY_DN1459_c0_g1~~TRINITY_DN1459_c0_g1_i1.p1  ORF type:complete len:270 (-),score=98.72 TRINITY_DN1459_c0_g1_i1:28-837(-)
MGDVWNLREIRSFPKGFNCNSLEHMKSWLAGQQFNPRINNNNEVKGSKKGIHVNFHPEISVLFAAEPSGAIKVILHYYAKLQVASGLVVGIITGGLSTAVGVATFATHIADAKGFVKAFWQALDAIALAPGNTLSREGFDEKPQQGQPPQQPGYAPQQGYAQPPQGYGAPVYSPPPQHYGQQPGFSPQQSEFATLTLEQLEKQLQYHKEICWKIEKEMFERRNSMQQGYGGPQTSPHMSYMGQSQMSPQQPPVYQYPPGQQPTSPPVYK